MITAAFIVLLYVSVPAAHGAADHFLSLFLSIFPTAVTGS